MTPGAPQRRHALREVGNALRWIGHVGALTTAADRLAAVAGRQAANAVLDQGRLPQRWRMTRAPGGRPCRPPFIDSLQMHRRHAVADA